jgi:hypothetical protein
LNSDAPPHLKPPDRSRFCGRAFFNLGSKKGKKMQKEQKKNLFALFATFLPFLLPKKTAKVRAHKIRCGQKASNPFP